uniref:Cadherin domain-containing protein n=1 Tax=Labrus bergylta TaxID=56723 RepID=A0A3Q3H3B4_9LABR
MCTVDKSLPFKIISSLSNYYSLVSDSAFDREKTPEYNITITATDSGSPPLSSAIKLHLILSDINDNPPLFDNLIYNAVITENNSPGISIITVNALDSDSNQNARISYILENTQVGGFPVSTYVSLNSDTGIISAVRDNGQVNCRIEENAPFKIKSNLRNYYTLVTDTVLDRESVSEYNITVVATDAGMPPLSSKRTFHLKVSDVNDNAPVFPQGVYNAFITENNSPGVSVITLRARDPDENQNARISYILEDTNIGGSPVSGFVSVNAESGVVHAVRSFDYEQLKELVFVVKAQDGGSPPLSSNVTVKMVIQDQNDNPPQVLYPVQTVLQGPCRGYRVRRASWMNQTLL